MAETPFDEGKAAKAAGKTDSENPYRAGSQDSLDWLEGFTLGEPEPSDFGANGAGQAEVSPNAP